MRFSRLALALAFGASRAWAQPAAGEPPAETPKDPPAEKDEKDVAPPASPTPEVGKDQVKQPPAAVATPSEPKSDEHIEWQAPHNPDHGFRFGSYGRVLAGSDLRGGKPQKVSVVAHGPRIVEDSYLELEFSYGFEKNYGGALGGENKIVVRPVITLAFAGTLFHDTGEFDAQPALRNMFLDGRVRDDLTLWVGSRMYRGDDIYLFDYWPLDDINTVGGGFMYSPKLATGGSAGDAQRGKLELAGHIGFNRLNNPFQFQQIDVPNPVQGATTVEQLNRQRTVASATASYTLLPQGDGIGAKVKVHSEFHSLPAGTFKRSDGTLEPLPADTGFLIGAELGAFGFSHDKQFRRHLNLFTRYAKGLAAFDELAPPTTFGSDLKTGRANELTFGLSGNLDTNVANMMVGVLSRRFVDADQDTVDADDGWEYAIDARPLVRIPTTDSFFFGGDISYQARFPRGLNNITLKAEDPAEFQIAPMFVWSPMGPSSYDRPQIRLVYRAAYLNQAALDLYVPDDPRHSHSLVHFLGLQAEWWFNSSTYR